MKPLSNESAGGEIHRGGGKLPQRREQRDRELTRVLRASAGIVALARLEQIGYSSREVEGLVRHGDLVRLHRGVYGDGRMRLHPRVRLKAALMALDETAFLSGRSAAAGWGLRPINAREIELTVVASSTPRRAGLVVHRVSRAPSASEIRTRDGMRLSSPARMLVEVAARAGGDELERLLTGAVRQQLLSVHELEATIRRHAGRPGLPRLRAVAAAYRPRPARRSTLEEAFDAWLATHPEIPEPERNVRLGNWEIDCWWPAERLVVELDGRPYHITAADFERDRIKDAWLQRRGIRVLRVTDERFELAWARVLDDLLGLLGLAGPAAA